VEAVPGDIGRNSPGHHNRPNHRARFIKCGVH
jgi:hypothetical protein